MAETTRSNWTTGAILFVVIGLAIFLLSGLCSGAMAWDTILSLITHERPKDPDAALGAVFAIWVGGPVMLFGLLFLLIGLAIRFRNGRRMRDNA